MLIIIENGQFGNQLFQFNYLVKISKPKEKIIFIGFDSLAKFIEKNERFIFIKKKNIFAKVIIKLREFIISFSKNIKLIKTIFSNAIDDIIINNGLLNSLILVDGHFEDEKLINKKFIKYFKNSSVENKAKNFIEKLKKNKKQKIFFIHIRLKDNLFGIDKNYPSVLPLKWFLTVRKILKKKYKNSKFIFLSDDLKFLQKNLKKNELYIKNPNLFYNFFIMKYCDGGILSPSTFSWWAAYLSPKKEFFAPKYWHGHRKKKQDPIKFKSNFLKYIRVKKSHYLTQIRNESYFYKILPFK